MEPKFHEFTVGDRSYRGRKLDARRQFHIVRRLAPILGELGPVLGKGEADLKAMPMTAVIEPLAGALAKISDTDADYVIFGLLRAVEVGLGAGLGWGPVVAGNPTDGNETLCDMNMDMGTMLQVAWASLRYNLEGFFVAPAPTSNAAQTMVETP